MCIVNWLAEGCQIIGKGEQLFCTYCRTVLLHCSSSVIQIMAQWWSLINMQYWAGPLIYKTCAVQSNAKWHLPSINTQDPQKFYLNVMRWIETNVTSLPEYRQSCHGATYRKIKDKHNKTGEGRKKWPFLDAMDAVLGDRPSRFSRITCIIYYILHVECYTCIARQQHHRIAVNWFRYRWQGHVAKLSTVVSSGLCVYVWMCERECVCMCVRV